MQFDLNQHRQWFAQSLVQLLSQVQSVQTLEPLEVFGDFLRLICLQMADEVPSQRKFRERCDLGKSLLQTILANIPNTTLQGLINVLGRDSLRDGDQFDGTRIAAAPNSCISNSLQDSQAILSIIDHRALRVRGAFVVSPATRVSSSAGRRDAFAFLVSLRLCFKTSIRSTTFAGPGTFVAGACGATPATFMCMISSTLS